MVVYYEHNEFNYEKCMWAFIIWKEAQKNNSYFANVEFIITYSVYKLGCQSAYFFYNNQEFK